MASISAESLVMWRVHLFDGPALADSSGVVVRKFRSQRVGALLAYLALRLGRACAREALCEALWPDAEPSAGANRLRVALASLRRQLEPSGVAFGAVLDVSEPGRVRLRTEAAWCDALAFDQLWAANRHSEAAALAVGDFMPGYYDEWLLEARSRYDLLLDDVDRSPGKTDAPCTEDPHAAREARRPPSQPRLPLYLTRFFGRERERDQLSDLIRANRLVTLAGPGGIGKTRLAVEASAALGREAVFVPLADLDDAARVPDAALRALFIETGADGEPVDRIAAILRSREPLVLILDNAEHLLNGVSELAARLLAAAPTLHIVITSRQTLDLPGEAIMSLAPLEPPSHPCSPERLAEFPAVALFLDRARLVRPDFTCTARNAEAIVTICQRLDGMPLGIELAAARISTQSPAQIADSLDAGLMELRSRQRGIPERHRSLRAAVQGSYDMLDGPQKSLFAALSTFRDGWTGEAAASVTGASNLQEWLPDMVARSLV
ncbi:MAG TPA: AAA family ATPase, partial [Chthonomonadaceae bacterium]|nr:AAA family ATPase [Chthonomonadaceae bacterium]